MKLVFLVPRVVGSLVRRRLPLRVGAAEPVSNCVSGLLMGMLAVFMVESSLGVVFEVARKVALGLIERFPGPVGVFASARL
jgi:hypothetical protein